MAVGNWTTPKWVVVAELYRQHLLAFARDNSLQSCDLAVQTEPSTEYLYDDCHFNVAGARLVAMHLE